MTPVDPRTDLSDIDLLLYWAMGPEPRSPRRLVELAAVAVAVLVGLWAAMVFVTAVAG